jgi:hypothetical protein
MINKKIKISNIEGFYYVDDNTLIYRYPNYYSEINECQVSDLCDLTIYQYNELVSKLNKYYPEYAIEYLEGRFI